MQPAAPLAKPLPHESSRGAGSRPFQALLTLHGTLSDKVGLRVTEGRPFRVSVLQTSGPRNGTLPGPPSGYDLWYPGRMDHAEPDRHPNAFERFVMRIARVPKERVDALEAAEKAAQIGVKRGPRPKRAKPV